MSRQDILEELHDMESGKEHTPAELAALAGSHGNVTQTTPLTDVVLAARAFSDKLKDQTCEWLGDYARAYFQHTGLRPDECELVVTETMGSSVSFRFMPISKKSLAMARDMRED